MLEISATILQLDGPDSSAHDSKATYWIVLEQYTKSLRGDINVFGSEGSQLSVEKNKKNPTKFTRFKNNANHMFAIVLHTSR